MAKAKAKANAASKGHANARDSGKKDKRKELAEHENDMARLRRHVPAGGDGPWRRGWKDWREGRRIGRTGGREEGERREEGRKRRGEGGEGRMTGGRRDAHVHCAWPFALALRRPVLHNVSFASGSTFALSRSLSLSLSLFPAQNPIQCLSFSLSLSLSLQHNCNSAPIFISNQVIPTIQLQSNLNLENEGAPFDPS